MLNKSGTYNAESLYDHVSKMLFKCGNQTALAEKLKVQKHLLAAYLLDREQISDELLIALNLRKVVFYESLSGDGVR